MSQYVTVHVTNEAIDGVVEVINRSRSGLPLERSLSADELRAMTVRDKDFRPEGSWFVTSDGVPIAYAAVLVEANRLAIGRDDAYVDLEVVPEERGRGLEQRMMADALTYVRSRGVGKARARCPAADGWRGRFLVSEGFSEASRVYTLVRRGRDPLPANCVPDGVRTARRPFRECGDEELVRIVEAFNISFEDHYNFAPERPERFIEFRDAEKDPTMVSLAMEDDRIVGLCLSDVSKVYNEENGTRSGWIGILGVLPSHRKKGVGRSLLVDGMSWILEQGMDTVHIGVFATNDKALALYRSLGFEKEHESIWYARPLV